MNSRDALKILSEDQRSILEQFRHAVQDILQPQHDDYYLLRWLRARDFDIRKSEKMIRESFKLRKKLNVEDIIAGNYVEPEVYKQYGIMSPLGFDKEGCCVRYAMAGLCDFKGFVYSLHPRDAIRMVIYILESDLKALAEHNKKTGLHEQRTVYIADFRDFSLRQAIDKQVIQIGIEVVRMYLDNYPETLKVAYLVNVPSYFSFFWNVFKPLLDAVTLKKIKIHSADDHSWKEELLKIVNPEIIPAFLGGSLCDPVGDPTCQNLIKWTDRKIPPVYYLKDHYLLRAEDPDVSIVVVRERSNFELRISVEKSGSTLKWEFQTKDYNIKFGVLYAEMKSAKASNVPPEPLIPVENVECHVIPEMGEFLCKKSGQYILHFENKYSWLTSKHLLYKVTVIEPEEDSVEEN